jgi:hypothetical protein
MYLDPYDLTIPPFLRRGPGNSVPGAAPPSSAPMRYPFGYQPAMPTGPAAPGTGFNLVGKPYGTGFTMPPSPVQLPALSQASGLPTAPAPAPAAPGGYQLPVRSLGNDAMSLLNRIPGLGTLLGLAGPAARGGAVAGPIGAAVGTGLSVMAPKPAGDANDNGTGTLLSQPTFPNGVPMPTPRPVNYGPEFNEAFGFTPPPRSAGPAPQANPYQRASDVGAAAQGNPYAAAAAAGYPSNNFGPGFGAGDNGLMSPANMGQGSDQTSILAALLKQLQGR